MPLLAPLPGLIACETWVRGVAKVGFDRRESAVNGGAFLGLASPRKWD